MPAACALPGEVGPADEAPSPLLTGIALLFSALLCLWREGSYHQLRGNRLRAQLPSALRRGRGMRHTILWSAQVRAAKLPTLPVPRREEPAATPPSILPEPEPRPGALSWSSALLTALLTTPIPSVLLPRSFCWEHRPRQPAEAAPSQNTCVCVICLEPVGDSTSYHTLVCPVCKQAWFHRACIRVGALPSPRGHGRCSAAASPAHAHAHTCASPAETCHTRSHHAFLLPRLRRKGTIPIPNDHAGDPNSNQVGVLPPGSALTQAQALCLPTNCPGRPSPLPSCKHRSHLHGAAGNELKGN